LERCVGSILSQESVDVRVLIIDDASTDHTPEVGKRIALRDERVEYRRHDNNRGHITTYNEGLLNWAVSKYSLLLSADDMLTPGALARATQVMDRHRDIGMIYGMALIITDDEGPGVVPRAFLPAYQIIPSVYFLQHCCTQGTNPVPTPTAVVRTALQHQIGGYRPELPHSGDMEMWMRFAAHGPVAVLAAVQAYYRWHGGNMQQQYIAGPLSDWRERIKACDHVLDVWGARFPETPSWRHLMRRYYGEEAFWLASRAFDRGDKSANEALLQFAEEIYPELRHSRMWRRLQLKKLLGQRLWGKLRPLLDRARGSYNLDSTSHLGTVFHAGQQIGWLPKSQHYEAGDTAVIGVP
jgi:glycosyltransferase involved in cell wall biosynthesis